MRGPGAERTRPFVVPLAGHYLPWANSPEHAGWTL